MMYQEHKFSIQILPKTDTSSRKADSAAFLNRSNQRTAQKQQTLRTLLIS